MLLQKAREDQHVLVALAGDAGTADAVLDFHAQKASHQSMTAQSVG
ncbi:MAG: hypothetical protein WD844_02995 [Thermoleophilaceae bacterium]